MGMLSHLLDATTMAKLTDSQVSGLNHQLELATANAVLNNPTLKTQLSTEMKAAAAPHR